MSDNLKYEYIVSACLLGEKCRYDEKVSINEKVKKLIKEKKAILVCPEVMGGMSIPRLPCEINTGKVLNTKGEDKTVQFLAGAKETLNIAKKYGIKKAILKEKSPSCGSHFIYDGSFSRNLIHGEGITTKVLRENGIEVLSDEDIENLK